MTTTTGCNEGKLVKIGNYLMTGKTLGKGHFARVEEAVHSILKVKVALKIIRVSELTENYVRKNLKREAVIMSKISHPNIICLFETIETERHFYIVGELCSGGDLCSFVKSQRHGKLEERISRRLAKQLASAVSHLHEKGIVHRDLKMENILLDSSKQRIKLVDFGLSNFCGMNEFLRTHCGSPEYAAPELFVTGIKYGPEVDVWSLGVVYYGMMVGKLPFQPVCKVGITPEEKRKCLMEETKQGMTINQLKEIRDCSRSLRNLLPKMLNTNSQERISIQDLKLHPWICDNHISEYAEVDHNLQNEIFMKICCLLDVPFIEVFNKITKKPYGPVGGMYNIERLNSLISKYNHTYHYDFLSKIDLGSRNFNKNYSSYYIQRPKTTCIENDGSNSICSKRRPLTTDHRKPFQNDLKATEHFQTKQEKIEETRKINNVQMADYFSRSKYNKKKYRPSSPKIVNFVNEKLKSAKDYGKRQNNFTESIIENGELEPFLKSKQSEYTFNEDDLSIHTDVCSENSSNQTARTKFIKSLCYHPADHNKNGQTSVKCNKDDKKFRKKLDQKTNKFLHNSERSDLDETNKNRPKSKGLSNVFKETHFIFERSVDGTRKQSTNSGIPVHTAARAALRKKFATWHP